MIAFGRSAVPRTTWTPSNVAQFVACNGRYRADAPVAPIVPYVAPHPLPLYRVPTRRTFGLPSRLVLEALSTGKPIKLP